MQKAPGSEKTIKLQKNTIAAVQQKEIHMRKRNLLPEDI